MMFRINSMSRSFSPSTSSTTTTTTIIRVPLTSTTWALLVDLLNYNSRIALYTAILPEVIKGQHRLLSSQSVKTNNNIIYSSSSSTSPPPPLPLNSDCQHRRYYHRRSFITSSLPIGDNNNNNNSSHRLTEQNNKNFLNNITLPQNKRTIMTTQIMRSYASHLTRKVVDLIQARGPLTVADYMKIVLTNPDNGFYMDKDVFGSKGHFITNPEISQIFGEICGVWILNEWQRFQCPKPLRIVELGPGRGTLMSDIARTLHQFRQSREVSSLHLVEVSPFLTQVQEQTLCGTTSLIGRNENNHNGSNHNSLTKNGLPVTWYRNLDQLEPLQSGFTAFVAHEFFDALPIHKFVRDPNNNNAWRELLVDYDQNHDLRYAISKQSTLSSRLLTESHTDSDIDHLEVCPEAGLHVQKIMKRLNTKNSGCALICDYGFKDDTDLVKMNDHTSSQLDDSKIDIRLRSNRDTFRGFKEHKQWPPLKEPGTADLTADVDFGYLMKQVENEATTFGPVPQADFLLKCGLGMRLQALMKNATSEESRDLTSGVNMMINDMGQRYKFMALFPKGTESLFKNNPAAGFD